MPTARSPADLIAAVESMFRIRAVESPPDEEGRRTIWHRGRRGAELVSEVDGAGRVERQELTLFDDCVVWEREKGFQTQRLSKEKGAAGMPSSAQLETEESSQALRRVDSALRAFRGDDRFIRHFRDRLVQALGEEAWAEDIVTRGAIDVMRDFEEAQATTPPPRASSKGLMWVVLGLLIIAVALVALVVHL